MAIQLGATEFLINDSCARQVAEQNFASSKIQITVRGTLGIIFLSFQKGLVSRERAIQLIETITLRRDIWISVELCDRVLQLIRD